MPLLDLLDLLPLDLLDLLDLLPLGLPGFSFPGLGLLVGLGVVVGAILIDGVSEGCAEADG